jgi:hypothetical protein
MSNKTKNCKKKCCCCCCKPKPPPPKPNLCENLSYNFTVSIKTNTLSLENGELNINKSFSLNPLVTAGQKFLNRYFTYLSEDGYKSLYTFKITITYSISTQYVYRYFENSQNPKPIYLDEYIYIMGLKTTLSQKSNQNTCQGQCEISDKNKTSQKDLSLTITPDSLISNIEFHINENTNNEVGDENTLEYNLNNGLITVGMFLVPLILRTLYEIPYTIVNKDQKQQIPLYDTTRTQTINQEYINSVTNNGFYYIDNINNNFIILATTYSVQYSFGGEFFFNIDTSTLEQNKNYTITINALIDSIDSQKRKIGETPFKKDMTSPTQGVKVNLYADVILLLDKGITHTINLFWTITSDKETTILDTKGSYFEFLVDNTALCNV